MVTELGAFVQTKFTRPCLEIWTYDATNLGRALYHCSTQSSMVMGFSLCVLPDIDIGVKYHTISSTWAGTSNPPIKKFDLNLLLPKIFPYTNRGSSCLLSFFFFTCLFVNVSNHLSNEFYSFFDFNAEIKLANSQPYLYCTTESRLNVVSSQYYCIQVLLKDY